MLANPDFCPEAIKLGIARFRDDHLRPGEFLRSVLCNDLVGANYRADLDSNALLTCIVAYCMVNLPKESWGTPEKVERWIAIGDAELNSQATQ